MELLRKSIPMTFLRFLSFIFLLNITSAQSSSPVHNFCGNSSTQQPLNSSYKTNINNLLSWMYSDAATSKGYNHRKVDALYGLYDCRRDITGYFCQFCLSNAIREIVQHCPNSVSAITWYDFCIVRYSNQSFLGKVTLTPLFSTVSESENISDSTELARAEDDMKSLIRKATVDTNQLYAMDEFDWSSNEKRYGMVQCGRDLTDEGCNQCLNSLLGNVRQCCGTKRGWELIVPSCWMKFNDSMFYQSTNGTSSSFPSPDPSTDGTKNSKTLIISIVCVLVAITLLSSCVYYFRPWNWLCNASKDGLLSETIPISFHHHVQREDSLNADLPTIPLIVIQQTTNHFSESTKLGEGGFGPVYKGTLPDGTEIAVKRLSKTSNQGLEEFKNEVIFVAKLQHRNLVRLLGCCIEENEKLLVYEYMANSSLDFHLFNKEKRKQLDWKLRLSIINGIAKGLLYLHEDSRLRVIHRDLKASNVLLDHEMNPKISDFGLARIFEIGQSQAKTKRVIGTYGYMAPEYAMAGIFSVKSDVFSFGVLLLEIICGKRNREFYPSEHDQSLPIYTWRLWCEGKSLELIDQIQEKSCIASEVIKCIHIGLLCVQEDAAYRPTMSTVVLMLGSETMTLPNPKQPAFSVGRMINGEQSTSKNSKDPSVNGVTISNVAPR